MPSWQQPSYSKSTSLDPAGEALHQDTEGRVPQVTASVECQAAGGECLAETRQLSSQLSSYECITLVTTVTYFIAQSAV